MIDGGEGRGAVDGVSADPGAVGEWKRRCGTQRVKRTKTVCTYCGVGCSFDVWTRDRHILKVEPAHGPANGISTCVKGKFAWEHCELAGPADEAADSARAMTFVEIEWDEAIGTGRGEVQEDQGGAWAGCAGVYCFVEVHERRELPDAEAGAGGDWDEQRGQLQPLLPDSGEQGAEPTVGYGGDSGSIADIEMAELVIIVGANTAESHPVLATRVKRSHKHRGQRLIVSDLRKHEMAERADIVYPAESFDR